MCNVFRGKIKYSLRTATINCRNMKKEKKQKQYNVNLTVNTLRILIHPSTHLNFIYLTLSSGNKFEKQNVFPLKTFVDFTCTLESRCVIFCPLNFLSGS